MTAAILLAFGSLVMANPTGPQVAAGSAGFQSAGSTLTVTNAPGTVINWQSFSIGAGELTRFQQQSALSAVLNRVTGADPSAILGTLSSNGRVFLVNPHGIVFGRGSVIDTAGFIASTLNIRDEDFLAGRLKFEGGGHGALRNEGAIRASGDIFLVGPQIENAGLIRSDAGSVLLAAGKSVTITSPDAHGVQFALQAPEDAALNLGTIEAKNAAGMFAGTLRHSGDIRATGASVDAAGRVILAAQQDAILEGHATVSADNGAGRGGSVRITGERVGLFDNATVTARGAAGGGEILVGGDYQGKNPEVSNAARTFVGRDVTLDADATGSGDGGRVIVWADDVARYHGHASVRGGAQGGDGGLVEVSGKNVLEFHGTVGLEALQGRGGTLLLDPFNITVQAGAGTLDGHLSAPGDPLLAFAEPDSVTSGTLSAASLAAFTAGTVELQAENDITFSGAVTMQSGVTLKAAAKNNVNVNAGIATSGGGMLLLEANTDNAGGGVVNLGTATINAPLRIGRSDATFSGNTTLTGDVILAQDTQIFGGLSVSSNRTLTVNTGSTLTVSGGMTATTAPFSEVTVTGGGILAVPAGQTFLFNSNDTRRLFLDNVTLNNAGTFQLNGSTSNNVVELNNGAVFNNLEGGLILFSQPGNTLGTGAGTGTFTNSGTIAAAGGANATLAMSEFNANNGSVFDAGAGGVFLGAGSSAYSGSLTLNSALHLTGGTHLFADGVTLNGTGALVHDGATSVTMNNVTANVAYQLTSNDTLTLAAGKTFTVAGGMTATTAPFQNSSIIGGGTLAIPTAATFTFNASDSRQLFLDNVTVNNSGTFTLNGSTSNNAVELNNGTVFNNLAGGEIRFGQPGNTLGTGAGAGTLNNSGTIAGPGGTITLGVSAVNNSGLLDVTANNAAVSSGLASLSGAIDVGAGRTLTVGGSGLDWQGGTLEGAGTYNLTGGLTITGSGERVLDGPTFNIASLTLPGGSLDVQAGTLNLTGTTTVAAGATLVFSGGALNLGGALNNSGTFDVNTGTFNLGNGGASSGTFDAAPGATINFSGGTHDLGGGTQLAGGGNFGYTGGTLNVNGAVTIAAGTTLSASGRTFGGTGTLANLGTVNLDASTVSGGFDNQGGVLNTTGATAVDGAFANAGTVSVNGGTLDFAGGYAQSAGSLMLAGGNVSGNVTLDGGTLGGGGTIVGDVINNTGTVAPGTSPGTLVINGDYTQGPGGTLDIELGGTAQGVDYDLLHVTGNASLGGTLNVAMFGGFTGVNGDFFDFMTYAGRSGDFATINLPAGTVMTATPNATFYQLALTTPPSPPLPPPTTGGAAPASDPPLQLAANDVRVLQDKFFAEVRLGKEDEDEEKKGAVFECR
ncbi:MAG: filamentous hemagglutinin N-terminal domain-containing protein [Burkholderiales bacterium]|nr:filamentous hemagglutinin N-terminal domain-containing protein [Burkholderiales bacterium]